MSFSPAWQTTEKRERIKCKIKAYDFKTIKWSKENGGKNCSLVCYYLLFVVLVNTSLKYVLKNWLSELEENNFEVLTRFRDDSNLLYSFYGEQKAGRGRPRKHEVKIDFKNLNKSYFDMTKEDDNIEIYSGVVFSKSLKSDVLVAIVYTTKNNKSSHKIYTTTNVSLTYEKLLKYYQTRFQIEFLYRDGK